ncbi:MAG TPA: hypothetical protein VK338_01355 [Candidatus Nitrosocosmicus sp.]|nr:hypothetical protein [Candidatus Nitrosocosmicus sp.]
MNDDDTKLVLDPDDSLQSDDTVDLSDPYYTPSLTRKDPLYDGDDEKSDTEDEIEDQDIDAAGGIIDAKNSVSTSDVAGEVKVGSPGGRVDEGTD